jgi:hypothetical protein
MTGSLMSIKRLFGFAAALFLLLSAPPALAQLNCVKTVCAATDEVAMSLSARACGWTSDFQRADCSCLKSGGSCGATGNAEPKAYRRCICGTGTGRVAKPIEPRKTMGCFGRVQITHTQKGALAAQVAALKCVGVPTKPDTLKALLGPKPAALVLVASQSFADKRALKSALNGQTAVNLIPNVLRLEVDPHVRRLDVLSNGRRFTLRELLAPRR